MSITPQYETYRYTSELTRVKAQSVVESRLPGSEIGSILTTQAKVYPIETVCSDGEVKYGGKLVLCIVYEDADGKICRTERGAEFYHQAEDKIVTPACFAKTALSVERVTYRREGSGLYFSTLVGAELIVYGGKQIDYLTGGENLFCKRKEIEIKNCVCVSGETEGEDEFEADFSGDILLHEERALVQKVSALSGQLEVEGEVLLNLCVLQADGKLGGYERIIPFKIVLPCEDAEGEVKAHAKATLGRVDITQETDEEKGVSKTILSYALAVDCFLYGNETLTIVEDAFSPAYKTTPIKAKDTGRYLLNTVKCVERIGGKATLSQVSGGEYLLECVLSSKTEIALKKTENGFEAEGVLTAEVLLSGKDGGYKKTEMLLPFLFPIGLVGDEAEAEALVCGLNIRRKKDGETEAEAIVKITARSYAYAEWETIKEMEIGEEERKNDKAFSVYGLCDGEELWEVAKRLKCDPEQLKKSNPDLQFPVKKSARIFVYRQIK